MTWSEIKKAVDDAGIAEDEEVSVIQKCQAHDGDKTLHKIKLGKFVKLSENFRKAREKKRVGALADFETGITMTWIRHALTTITCIRGSSRTWDDLSNRSVICRRNQNIAAKNRKNLPTACASLGLGRSDQVAG